MIKAFDSPYLVKIVKDSYIEHKKYYCFVMEYYKNGSLSNLIVKFKNQKNDERSTDYELIFNLSKDIINGLDYLHSDGIKIIHRDLKPENILLNEKNEIKIADFGISKILHNDDDSTMTTNQGTKNYMSPEIINSKEYNFKTDVWSAGCVIFELIFLKVFKLIENSFEANIPERLSQLIGRFVFHFLQ